MDVGFPIIVVLLGCGALLVRVGMGWYGSGAMRAKNAASVVLRNVIDLSVATLSFWAIGSAIMQYGGSSPIGIEPHLLFGARDHQGSVTFINLIFVLIGTAPVAGALAERTRFFPLLAVPALLGAIVIPICGQWAWDQNGWLRRMGFFDVAGASVLHVVGGLTALVGAIIAGPRTGKHNTDGSSNLIPGHSVPMASVGMMLMLAGWLPYMLAAGYQHGGLSRAALNTMLSASAGAIIAVIVSNVRYGKPDVMLTYGGLFGGLVAITAAGGAVSGIAAVTTGAVAGLLVPTAIVVLDLILKVDDPAGAVAVHVVGGAWGILALGLFCPAVTVADKFKFIGVQLLGLIVIAVVALVFATGLFLLLKATVGLRLHEDAEYDGADLAEHDLNAYPDFQQTMIKSYHLREA